tara:strand:+ start:1504 stop:1860 length:357 start_codon:yes stop_codon:yes gene_type:complete
MRKSELFDYVIDAVQYASGIRNIKEKTRQREYVDARRIAYHMLRKIHGLPLQAIGKEFNKHHASVLHGIKDVDFLIKTDSVFEQTYHKAMAQLSIGNYRKEQIIKEIKKLQEEFLTIN